MNKIFKIVSSLIVGIMFLSSCTPEEYSMGAVDVKPGDLVEGIAFKIEHDAVNPNIVYLKSLMGNQYTPLWNHPHGRSQDQVVTLKMPFPGTYQVTFGVETRGGMIYGDPVTFEVEDLYPGFISDPLWTLLAGGPGNEKTWLLDLNADGQSRYFTGPLFFYGTDDSWSTVTDGIPAPEGSDSWSWTPDYPGNSWLMTAGDYGSMTFSLKGGAFFTADHKMISSRGIEHGTYLMDVDGKTMSIVDGSPLHDSGRDPVVSQWGNIKILSLTDTHMQLAVLRDKDPSEGPCLLVYNFISNDYYDNWTPGEQPDPEPPYTGNANEDLTTSSSTTKKWELSLSSPYNWTDLGGEFLNAWTKPEDYAATGWAPYEASTIKNISLTLVKTSTDGGNYVFTDGNKDEITGTYTIDEKNNINFGKSISFPISGWAALSTTADNSLRLLITEKDGLGKISGMWLGQRDPAKSEYQGYHFVPAGTQNGAE